MRDARVIISGATGFLGGALALRLLRDGGEVIALGRNPRALEGLSRLGARAIAHDLATGSPPEIPEADIFVHSAALSSPWGRASDFHAANVTGTANALAIARKSGVRRFVHISTPSIYFRFADQSGLREDAPLPKPVNHYAATKRIAEKLVLEQAEALDPVILRPRGIYGAGDVALLPRLLKVARKRALPLMRDGAAATDLTHVDDVVSATLAAASASPNLQRRVFNVSGGEALNVRQVIERVGARAGVPIRWRRLPASAVLGAVRLAEAACAVTPGRPEPLATAYSIALLAYTQTLDISAARDGLGWGPAVSFDEGLERTFGVRA